MGAGVIGVAAIWTLIKLAGPSVGGLTSALAANRRRAARCWTAPSRTSRSASSAWCRSLCLVPIGC
jgi:uncharacterized oligopeptide transporter (OPT) family protein